VPPKGVLTHVIQEPGLVELISDASDDPIYRIFVAPSQLVQICDSRARPLFNDLAPGEYKVTCWHPRLPGSSQQVQLASGRLTTATLSVGVNSLPKIN